jgi:hypothetical protein
MTWRSPAVATRSAACASSSTSSGWARPNGRPAATRSSASTPSPTWARIRAAARRSRLMVRVNPLNPGSADEIDAVLAEGPDLLMLPMFHRRGGGARVLHAGGRARALHHLAGDRVGARHARRVDRHAGPGGGVRRPERPAPVAGAPLHVRVAGAGAARRAWPGRCRRQDCGSASAASPGSTKACCPGRDVLAEHLRLGSRAVILSRTFHRGDGEAAFEREVAGLREVEAQLGGGRRSRSRTTASASRHHRRSDAASRRGDEAPARRRGSRGRPAAAVAGAAAGAAAVAIESASRSCSASSASAWAAGPSRCSSSAAW